MPPDQNPVLDAFEKAMTPPAEPSATVENEQQPTAPAKEGEDAEAPKKVESTDEAPAEEQQKGDTETIEIDPEEEIFETTYDTDGGSKETKRLSLKELQGGYMRTADYTRKTKALSEQIAKARNEAIQANSELAKTYQTRLQELHLLVETMLAPELKSIDLDRLAVEDGLGYITAKHRVDKIKEAMARVQDELKTEAAKQAEKEKQEKAERWRGSLEVLQREIKDFGPEVVKRLIEAGPKWGFSAEEVSKWDDHRYIRMLHALDQRKDVQEKVARVEKKVALVTKVLTPGAKAAAASPTSEALAKLRKSGRREDALPIFESMLGR